MINAAYAGILASAALTHGGPILHTVESSIRSTMSAAREFSPRRIAVKQAIGT
jgi:hypothetical protein